MITIFNGRRLTLGQGSPTEEVYVQVSVALRDHLHHFKGARLAVFFALALHADRDGIAYPSVETLCRETGYLRKTVSAALTELCELKIDGYPVLARMAQRDNSARFSVSRFQLFPANVSVGKNRPTVADSVSASVSKNRPTVAPLAIEKKALTFPTVGKIRPTVADSVSVSVGKKGDTAAILELFDVGKKGDTGEIAVVENKEVTESPCTSSPCTENGYTAENRVPENGVPKNGTRPCKGIKNNHVGTMEPSFGGSTEGDSAPVAELQEFIPTSFKPTRKPSSDDVTPSAFREPLEKRFLEYQQVEPYEMTGPEMARLRAEIKRLWVLGKKQIVMLDEFLVCFNELATMRYPSGTLKFTSLNWGLVGKKYRDWRAGRLKDEYNGNGFAPGKDVKKNAGSQGNIRSLASADII